MRNLSIAVSLLLILLCSISTFAQPNRQVWQEGKVFLKLKENVHPDFLPSWRTPAEEKLIAQSHPFLAEFIKIYGISACYHPFQTRSAALDRTFLLQFDPSITPQKLIRAFSTWDEVEYVEQVPLYHTDYTPNDYSPTSQYYLPIIGATDAWDLSQGSSDVVIAIVDNAVEVNHPDLMDNIWVNLDEIAGNGIDDDNNGYVDDVNGWDAANEDGDPTPGSNNFGNHGTHVAGCASATTDNNVGIASIGFSCKLMAIKSKLDGTTGSGLNETAGGVDYAIATGEADIVNMSFGGSGYSNTYQNLINAGYNAGVIFVAAAGNDGTNSNQYPAAYNHVISVGSTNILDQKSGFSNFGTSIDVMAPGSGIYSTTRSGYGNMSGTSMASPIVAGLIGLMKSINPGLLPDEAELCLESTCENIDAQNPGYVGLIGAGRIDAYQALACVSPQVAPLAVFSALDSFSCDGSIQFVDESENIPTNWFWDFGNGTTSIDRNPTAQFDSSGTYTVTLVVSNTLGSDQIISTVNVIIGDMPMVNAGVDVDACFGDTLQLIGSSSLSGDYQWTPSIGLSATNVLNPILAVQSGIPYHLTVTTAEGCSSTDTVQITVHPSATTYAGLNVTIQPGDSTQLNALGAATYEWSPSTGLSNPNISNPKASPATSTLYTVTGYSAGGCEKLDSVWVYVETASSIESISSEQGIIHPLYPNPTSEELHCQAEFYQNGHLSITLINLEGKMMETLYDRAIEAGPFHLEWNAVANLPPAIYAVVWEMNGRRFVQRMIVK